MSKPTLIFLDLDGVMCTEFTDYNRTRNRETRRTLLSDGTHYFYPFDPQTVGTLNKLTDSFLNPQIVLTSVWRFQFNFQQLQEILQKEGVTAPLMAVTPVFHGEQRGEEIKFWLDNSPMVQGNEAFVVFDDDSDMDAVRDNFIQVDAYDGLRDKYLKTAHRILRRHGAEYKDDLAFLRSI